MKILLISSPIALLSIENFARLPSLGLASIAGNLDKSVYDIKIADLILAPGNPDRYFKKLLSELKPDMIGFSAMTFQYSNTLKLAKIAKEFNHEITTVLGGYHATTAYKEILLNDYDMSVLDFVVRGEGETTMKKLLKFLYDIESLSKIPGLSFRINGKVQHNIPYIPEKEKVISSILPPDRSLRVLKRGFYLLGHKAETVETSRGCIFACDYCSINSMYGKNFRTYDIERVIDDIKSVRNTGAKFIFLVDDNITLDVTHLKKLCKRITEEKLNNLNYVVQVPIHPFLKNPDLPGIMCSAGIKYLFISIESPERQKIGYADDVVQVVSAFRQFGAFILGGFVVGLPDDNEEKLQAMYKFAKQTSIDLVAFMILTPYPGTETRKQLKQQGLISNLDDYSKYVHIYANIRTENLSSQEIATIAWKMNARYLLESGKIFRLFKKFPMHITKRIFLEFIKAPKNMLERIKGIKKL